MSDDSGKSKKLSLSGGGKLTLGGIEAGAMPVSYTHLTLPTNSGV